MCTVVDRVALVLEKISWISLSFLLFVSDISEMIFIIVFFVLLFVAFLSLVIYLAVIDAKDEADDINRASKR